MAPDEGQYHKLAFTSKSRRDFPCECESEQGYLDGTEPFDVTPGVASQGRAMPKFSKIHQGAPKRHVDKGDFTTPCWHFPTVRGRQNSNNSEAQHDPYNRVNKTQNGTYAPVVNNRDSQNGGAQGAVANNASQSPLTMLRPLEEMRGESLGTSHNNTRLCTSVLQASTAVRQSFVFTSSGTGGGDAEGGDLLPPEQKRHKRSTAGREPPRPLLTVLPGEKERGGGCGPYWTYEYSTST